MAAADTISRLTRSIPDFPAPGVDFKDLTPILADGQALAEISDALVAPFEGTFDVIAGIEARGFAFAAAAAARSGTGVILVRKAGKLPGATFGESYELEYGTAQLEVHVDQVPRASRVLIIDDVLATGGTLEAAARLVERAGWFLAGAAVVLELPALRGRDRLGHIPHLTALAVD